MKVEETIAYKTRRPESKADKKLGIDSIMKEVKLYINEQEGKDVFEYSVFGSPQQKIGQFASQTKLREWS